MRRYASVWAVGHAATKAIVIPGAQGVGMPEGDGSLSEGRARRELHPAGSSTTARPKRTAQKPGRPSLLLVKKPASGEPTTDLRRAACLRDAHAAGHLRWHRTSARDEVGRRRGTTGAEADGDEGVGGLHTSFELSKGPMTGASTSGRHVTATSKGSGTSATGTRRTVSFTCASDRCARAGGCLPAHP